MIFMNWRSRSSRAMAPKMRVPRGSFSLLIRTTALRSNRPSEPSLPRAGLVGRAGAAAEGAGAARLVLVVDQDGGVAVEPDVRAVLAAGRVAGPDHDAAHDVAGPELAAARGLAGAGGAPLAPPPATPPA